MKSYQITYLSLGSNLGNKIENLQKAINLLSIETGTVEKISSIYKTKSWGFRGEDFYNICIKISTFLSSETLLKSILDIEHKLGRTRDSSVTFSNRIIDIDILLFGNEIIFSKDLIVPHPKMLERKFVLTPLNEIAKNVIHPSGKKTIENCLKQCTDNENITLTKKELNKPLSLSEKYNFIAIEGNIGAGKTSLTKLLSKYMNAKIVLERFEDNAFLPKFYKNKERFAFPLEMSFLADRFKQLTDDLAQFDLFKSSIISDYYIFKSLIFANVTLQKEEYNLYRKIFDIMYKDVVKPDLYIYLYQNTGRLIENIKKRGRKYEQNISSEYLKMIHNGYYKFISTQKKLNFLIIDVSNLDFVKNNEDFHFILKKILNH